MLARVAIFHHATCLWRQNRRALFYTTGKSPQMLVKLSARKYFAGPVGQIIFITSRILSRQRGVGHRHERWSRSRWTRVARETNAPVAYGEVVWTRRPDAGVKFCDLS